MVWRQCDNPNDARRHWVGNTHSHISKFKNILTEGQHRAFKGWQTRRINKLLRQEKGKHFSKGHMKNVVRYMPYVRECRNKSKPPSRVPLKVMQTIIALELK